MRGEGKGAVDSPDHVRRGAGSQIDTDMDTDTEDRPTCRATGTPALSGGYRGGRWTNTENK